MRLPGELLAEPRQSRGNGNGRADDYTEAEPDPDVLEMVAELRERLGRAEGELAAELRHSQGLAEAMSRAEARADRLAAELAEARKGWLERLIGAVRQR